MPFVLVVDDDSAVRRMLLLLLSSEGYETETANDGAEALALMQQRRPCLVLLDIKMPLMDGWEFRKQQLENPALADVPVVCMTGIVHPEDVERVLGVPCLRKPVDFPSLIRAVEKFCRRERPIIRREQKPERRSGPPDRRRTTRKERRHSS